MIKKFIKKIFKANRIADHTDWSLRDCQEAVREVQSRVKNIKFTGEDTLEKLKDDFSSLKRRFGDLSSYQRQLSTRLGNLENHFKLFLGQGDDDATLNNIRRVKLMIKEDKKKKYIDYNIK